MPLELIPLPDDRFDEWRSVTRDRLIALRQESGMLRGADAVAHADSFLGELLAKGHETETSLILTIVDASREIGTLWLAANDGMLFVVDLAFRESPDARQCDELFDALTALGQKQGVDRLSIELYATDDDGAAFIEGRGFALASMQMLLEPLPARGAEAEGESVVVVSPMTAERFPRFAAASEAAFADDLVTSGRYSPADAAKESHRQMSLELPDGIDSPGQLLFTAHVGEVEVGVVWIGVRSRDGRPHAFVLDVEVAEGQRRRGYGRALMLAAEREARRFGAGSIGLHVFGFNDGAIALYESLGYRGVERRLLLSV